MRTAALTRNKTGPSGTFGELVLDGGRKFITGELPWKNNMAGISCIPAGEYLVRWEYSPSHDKSNYRLVKVPGRIAIEIHAGNFCGDVAKGLRSDVQGCILLGRVVSKIEGQDCVVESRVALAEFEKEMGGEPFTLKIAWRQG